MITEQKAPKGWKIEKMTFPKGFVPPAVKWRTSEEGLHYVWVDRVLLEDDDPDELAKDNQLEDAQVKEVRGKKHLVGWLLQEPSSYNYDRETATF